MVESVKRHRFKVFPEPITLVLDGLQYHDLELSYYSDRCLFFSRTNPDGSGSEVLFLFFDYRLEQIDSESFHFSGYLEMEGGIPGEEHYRYAMGEFYLRQPAFCGPMPSLKERELEEYYQHE